MIKDVLKKMQREALCDWGVLMLGVSGLPGTPERLSAADIAPFARERLASILTSDPALDIVVALAEEGIHDPVELRQALAALCEAERIDIDRSSRIWRCGLMKSCLADLEPDPVYGLLRLTGFWSAWGWPADAPASVQRGANVPAAEYHSHAHYRKVLREHRAWLEREDSSWCP